MIRQWEGAAHGWRLDIKGAEMHVDEEPTGQWSWALSFRSVRAFGRHTYKTAAGAARAFPGGVVTDRKTLPLFEPAALDLARRVAGLSVEQRERNREGARRVLEILERLDSRGEKP